MANKRIELEQYKHYINLWEEEPNRKTARRGVLIVTVVSILLVVFMIVAGWLSNSLALNPRNVLEKPPAPSQSVPSQQVPGGTNIPGGTNVPGGASPVPVTPQPSGQLENEVASNADAVWDTQGQLAKGVSPGALIAQQTPLQVPGGISSPAVPPGLSVPSASSAPAAASEQNNPGPVKETKGVGNLGNLAKGVNNRAFELYVLLIGIALIVVLYMAFRQARKEGKST